MISVTTTSAHKYPIHISHSCADEITSFIDDHFEHRNGFIVIDERVADLYMDDYIEIFNQTSLNRLEVSVIPEGEQSKSMEQYQSLLDDVMQANLKRSDCIFAIGGGVTGDLAGFVAATALRGIGLVHLPTTLLAMVDSSIGGKTGINHATGKNRIGSFYQPEAIFMETRRLVTLSEKEWMGGLGEVLKYGCISDRSIIDESQKLVDREFMADEKLARLIKKSAQIKANIVQKDEKEQGIRAWLNFGHTTAHAIERVAEYGSIPHGVAVFMGMVAELKLSDMHQQSDSLSGLLDNLLEAYRPFTKGLNFKPELLHEVMAFDKKNKNDQVTFVLLTEPGSPYVTANVSEGHILESLNHMIETTTRA